MRDSKPGALEGLFHSDQGNTYSSACFIHALSRYSMVHRMSRRGNCWDNAVVERVFRSLKHEWASGQTYRNHEDARRDVDVTAHLAFYNYRRWHAAMG